MPVGSRIHPRRAWGATMLLAVVAVVLLIAGCGGGASTLDRADTGRAAEFVPSGTQLYFDISTDFDGGQWRQATDIAARFPAFSLLTARAKSELSEGRLDFDRDIRPLLGDSAALAFPDLTNTDDPPVLMVLSIADGRQDDVVKLFSRDSAAFRNAEEYRGVRIGQGDDIALAVFDDALVASQSPDTVAAAIDARRDGIRASVAGSKKVRDALAGLPDEVLVQGYVDIAEIAQRVGAAQGPVVRQQLEAMGISPDAGIALSLSAEADGIRIKALASKVQDAPQTGLFTPTLADRLPASTVGYMGANDLFAIGQQSIARFVEGNAEAERILTQMRGVLGLIGLPADDLRNLFSGEVALAVVPGTSGPLPVDVLGILAAQDGRRADATLANIVKSVTAFFGSQSGAPSFAPMRLANGVSGGAAHFPNGLDVVYGVDGENVFLGTDGDLVRSAQNPSNTLAEDPAYRRATDQMPTGVQTVTWINVQRLLTIIEHESPSSMDAMTRANLQPIRNVAGWSTLGDRPTFELFITIE